MGQWVVTVAGIAILSVLCDIILPDGQTRKYIKTVIGVVVTLVMIQPIVGFLQGSLSVDYSPTDSYSEVFVQQSYVDMVEDKQLQERLTNAEQMLNAYNINVQSVELNKRDKIITLKTDLEYSSNVKCQIDKIFKTYFDDYKITIKWK